MVDGFRGEEEILQGTITEMFWVDPLPGRP